MRRQQTSIMVTLLVVVGLCASYLILPVDPFSSTIQRFIYGVDNAVEPDQSGVLLESNRVAELEAENQRLKELLSYHSPNASQFTTARVVSKSVQNYRSTFDVAIGADSGVSAGQAVLAGGQLIGRVTEVTGNRARVLSLSDPDFRAAAIIEGSNIEGLVRHVPGGTVLEQVPSEDAAQYLGARVITSGLGGVFSPGLFIGRLGDDVSAENAIFKEFIVADVIDITSVQEVVILR